MGKPHERELLREALRPSETKNSLPSSVWGRGS